MIKRRFAILTTAGFLAAAGLTACGSSSTTSATPAAAATSTTAPAPTANGQAPTGRPPGGAAGFGTPATGTAATKASAAATAKYPGTAERVMKLSDGSYLVHVLTSSSEVHVKVSKTFVVTGVAQGGPPAGAGPQASSTAPATTSS